MNTFHLKCGWCKKVCHPEIGNPWAKRSFCMRHSISTPSTKTETTASVAPVMRLFTQRAASLLDESNFLKSNILNSLHWWF